MKTQHKVIYFNMFLSQNRLQIHYHSCPYTSLSQYEFLPVLCTFDGDITDHRKVECRASTLHQLTHQEMLPGLP